MVLPLLEGMSFVYARSTYKSICIRAQFLIGVKVVPTKDQLYCFTHINFELTQSNSHGVTLLKLMAIGRYSDSIHTNKTLSIVSYRFDQNKGRHSTSFQAFLHG